MRLTLISCFAAIVPLYSQGVISTIAGRDWAFPELDLSALDAPIGSIADLTEDSQGNVYIADDSNEMVMRIGRDGKLKVVAGNGFLAENGDGGQAARAAIMPVAIAVDPSGNLYICSSTYIRKVGTDGVISTIHTFPFTPVYSTGIGIAADKSGNIYFVELINTVVTGTSGFAITVKKMTPQGAITLIAGNGQAAGSGDGGQAINAGMGTNRRSKLQFDAAGNLYISTTSGVRRVTPGGVISTVLASFASSPFAVDSSGKVYNCGQTNVIKYVGLSFSNYASGSCNGSLFVEPSGTVVAAGGQNTASTSIDRLARLSPSGSPVALAGNGLYRTSGLTIARNYLPGTITSVAPDYQGNVYFADPNRVFRISPDGALTVVAGTGNPQSSANPSNGGPATAVDLGTIYGIAADRSGNLYIQENQRIRKITPDGIISSPPGSPIPYTGTAIGNNYDGIALDSQGNLYELFNRRVYLFKPGTSPVPIAGNGQAGCSGSGGAALNASIDVPYGVDADSKGNVFITGNCGLQKISTSGTITTLSSDRSLGVAIDPDGNPVVANASEKQLIRFGPDGKQTIVAGSATGVERGDGGLATDAAFQAISGFAYDANGNLYIADQLDHRVRMVSVTPPSFQTNTGLLNFTADSQGAPSDPATFLVTASVTGMPFTVSSAQPWLQFAGSDLTAPRLVEVVADPATLGPGDYNGFIQVHSPVAVPQDHNIAVHFHANNSQPPKLELDKTLLTFTFPRAGTARSQILNASNTGGGSLALNATASVETGGTWLRVSPASASATARLPVAFTITADPSNLTTGTYRGAITITGPDQQVVVTVVATISDKDQAILLTQSGLSFTTVATGGVAPPQDFGIVNLGVGVMPWTIDVSTLSGGSWLTTAQSNGSTDAGSTTIPTLSVQVDQTGLMPGRYYGQVSVESPDVPNSPQIVTIFLQVLPADQNPGAIIQPAELVFVDGVPGQSVSLPGSQDFHVYNLKPQPVSFRSSSTSLALLPAEGTVVPAQPTRVSAEQGGGFGEGTRRENVTLEFDDGTAQSLRVLFVPAGSKTPSNSAPSNSAPGKAREGDTCQATSLLPAVVTLGEATIIPAGWPAGLVIDVQDDCSRPLVTGSVTVSFSNGDQTIPLQSLKDGRWHGTWQSQNAAGSQVTIRVEAHDSAQQLSGTREVSAQLGAEEAQPEVGSNAVVSAASLAAGVPLAPGGLVSLFGSRLTEGLTDQATTTPLPSTLGGAQVFITGRLMPLSFANSGQINGIVPADLPTNTIQQIYVRRGFTQSNPISVNVADAQPAFFNSENHAIAVAVRGDAQFLVTSDQPATAGDTLVLYCAGLGATDPSVTAGTPAPLSALAPLKNPLRLFFGTTEGTVIFAGLTPGSVGLYQVNAIVPQDAPKDDHVEMILETSGQRSPAGTVSIH